MANRTLFRALSLSSTVPTQIFSKDPNRVGYSITNRTTTGSTVYLNKTKSMTGFIATTYTSITLLQNETLECLATEKDDCTDELWGMGFALTLVEIIETIGD